MPDMTTTVLVTEPEYRKGEASYLAAPNLTCVRAPEIEEDLASAIRDARARYVIVGNRKYSGPLYDALPSGGVIARMGVGHDGIDKSRATAAHLFCTNTPGVLDQSVAEHAMLLIAAGRTATGSRAGEHGQRRVDCDARGATCSASGWRLSAAAASAAPWRASPRLATACR